MLPRLPPVKPLAVVSDHAALEELPVRDRCQTAWHRDRGLGGQLVDRLVVAGDPARRSLRLPLRALRNGSLLQRLRGNLLDPGELQQLAGEDNSAVFSSFFSMFGSKS